MQLITVGTKYQVVIPKEIRKKIKGLEPGAKMAVKHIGEDTITLKPIKQSWSDKNYGSFKKYWKDIDPADEVRKMKVEWEERLQRAERLKKSEQEPR